MITHDYTRVVKLKVKVNGRSETHIKHNFLFYFHFLAIADKPRGNEEPKKNSQSPSDLVKLSFCVRKIYCVYTHIHKRFSLMSGLFLK